MRTIWTREYFFFCNRVEQSDFRISDDSHLQNVLGNELTGAGYLIFKKNIFLEKGINTIAVEQVLEQKLYVVNIQSLDDMHQKVEKIFWK